MADSPIQIDQEVCIAHIDPKLVTKLFWFMHKPTYRRLQCNYESVDDELNC